MDTTNKALGRDGDAGFSRSERLARLAPVGMDDYTKKKRAEDGICRLGLGQKGAKLRDLHKEWRGLLLQQDEAAAALNAKVSEDLKLQTRQVRATHAAVKQSKQPGPLKYTKSGQSDMQHQEYKQSVQNMNSISANVSAVMNEIHQLEKEESKQRPHPESAGVNSMAGWFARYGKPKSELTSHGWTGSVAIKPRRRAAAGTFDGYTSATTLRPGRMLK